MEQGPRRAIAIFTGLLTVGIAFSIPGIADKPGSAIAVALSTAISAVLFYVTLRLWQGSKRDPHGGGRRLPVANEAAAFFDAVNRDRAFPPPSASRILDTPERQILAACDAKLLELGVERTRGYVGTRVKIGSMPLYLGKSAGTSKTVLKEAARGELAATTRGLLFSGQTSSLEIPYGKIIAVDTHIDGVTVAASDRAKPVTFIVANGLLWGMLLRNLVNIKLTSRQLPEGVSLLPLG